MEMPNYPVWSGPCGTGSNGGITYSLLSRFLCCRERFRLLVVEGLKTADTFNHRIEYGNMWHVCEEALALSQDWEYSGFKEGYCPRSWITTLTTYSNMLCTKYPTQQEQISHWYNVCKTQFPIYIDYWSKHHDVENRTPLLQESVFDVLYKIPSGKVVRLRGKWDSVDLVGSGKDVVILLKENKTKGDIREAQIKRQLTFDLQTMLYIVALRTLQVDYKTGDTSNLLPDEILNTPIAGIIYNVVRRPLSGGRGSIIKHKPSKSNPKGETPQQFYARLGGIISSEPDYYFHRWRVEIIPSSIERFKRQCLDPILEQLCDWWTHITSSGDQAFMMNYLPSLHWRHPYGVYNSLDEGGSTDLDEYLASGSELGLERTSTLFGELNS